MYRRTVGPAIGLMIALVISGVGLTGCKKSARAAELSDPDDIKVPEGYVVVEEDVLLQFVDSPGEHFHKARQSFLKKDFKAAAEDIRKGAAFLRLQAARATNEGKKGLMASVAELEKLANDVEKGTVTSAKTLDRAFARAHHKLAQHHYLKALDYKAKKDTKRLGHSLKAAAVHLEHGFAWAGHELEAGTVKVVRTALDLGGKLIEGTGWITEEVGKAIEYIGQEIKKLGKML
jgi:hypothetical protein